MPYFDFSRYLCQLDPSHDYTIETLTGGVINFTIRARKSGGRRLDVEAGCFPEYQSLILKQAPPFMAGVGESVPVSQYRQIIEARALSLFSYGAELERICNDSAVRVPTVLHYDPHAHVLVISDLGTLPNLSDAFSTLGGYNPTISPAVPATSMATMSLSYYFNIGRKLGSFFARLHSQTSLSIVRKSAVRDEQFLYDPTAREVVFKHAIEPIRAQLESFPGIFSPGQATELYKRVAEDFLRPAWDIEECLVLGDCWPGAILVGSDESDPTVGIIDWEFASIGRGINGDISQLLAHLQLFQIAAEWRGEKYLQRALDILVCELANTYRCCSTACQIMPATDPGNWTKEAKVWRSAFLSHGAEMINCAFWKVWLCNDSRCGTPHPDSRTDCELIRKMVTRGSWYLIHASQDEETFVSQQNWSKVTTEQSIRRMFQSIDPGTKPFRPSDGPTPSLAQLLVSKVRRWAKNEILQNLLNK